MRLPPEILPYEIGNALIAMVKRKQLMRDEALSAFEAASSIPVRLVSVDIQKALKLALDYNIYPHDAYFLQCATYLSIPFIMMGGVLRVSGFVQQTHPEGVIIHQIVFTKLDFIKFLSAVINPKFSVIVVATINLSAGSLLISFPRFTDKLAISGVMGL